MEFPASEELTRSAAVQHLTQRVAWHDRRWNGHICAEPSANAFCVLLNEVRKNRQDELEDTFAGRNWTDLGDNQLPRCSTQAGGFMNADGWTRVVRHVYQTSAKTEATRGHLEPTPIRVDPFSLFAVPLWWMLTENRPDLEWLLDAPYPSASFPGLKRNELKQFAEYRTQRYVLHAYDQMARGKMPDLKGV